MHKKDGKPLFDILLNLSEKEAEVIRQRLIYMSRRKHNSRLLELFTIITVEKIASDVRAAREMGYAKPASAYINTKKRLLTEVLIELHQLEAGQLRAAEFPDDQVIIHQILSDAHLMWKRGLLEVAINFFYEAYGIAVINEDYFLLTIIAHRLKVLSTYNPQTITDFETHAAEADAAAKSVMFINDLSTAYYKLRFCESFFNSRSDFEKFAEERLELLRKMYKQSSSSNFKMQVLNQMIQCYEVGGANRHITAILYLMLRLVEVQPTHSLTIADAAIKQARYYLLKKDFRGGVIALNNTSLQKLIVSNRLYIYKEWLVLALMNLKEVNTATEEINNLKEAQQGKHDRGRFVDVPFLECLVEWQRGNRSGVVMLMEDAGRKVLLPQQQLKRLLLATAAAIDERNAEHLQTLITDIRGLIDKNILLSSPRNRAVAELADMVLQCNFRYADVLVHGQAQWALLTQYVWHPLCDDAVAIDALVLKECNKVPSAQV